MHYQQDNFTQGRSVLASLRTLFPTRPLQFSEALRVAKLQANRLLELARIASAPVAAEVITGLPRILVDYEVDMPCSGASAWDNHRKTWVITLNALEPDTRQRFSLAHEYWHIIAHGSAGLASHRDFTFMGRDPVEAIAEYFAACLLMPKRLVKRAWGEGHQRVSELSNLFDVSPRAMKIRLEQLGLVDRAPRCEGRQPASGAGFQRRYRRALSANWSPSAVREVAA